MKLSRRLFLYLTIMGPGLITAIADNDAGGIATYSVAGAELKYRMLWVLLLTAFGLVVVQEMVARMGTVTKKGLSDLIREHFGFKWTFFCMMALLLASFTTTISEFAGIAASLELFKISRYLAIPLISIIIWLLIVKGNYKKVERTFLFICLVNFSYVLCGFLARPNWPEVFKATFLPNFSFDPNFIKLTITVIGTTIAPWMMFYMQASILEKDVSQRDYKYLKADVLTGVLFQVGIAFFIVVYCGATLNRQGIRIETAQEAALALRPLAGNNCFILFASGLFAASFLGASVLPLSTAYALCEAFGFESGVDKSLGEAPIFFGLFTVFLFGSAAIVLFPNLSLISLMIISQTICGIVMPIVLVFMLLLINNKRLMGNYTNSPLFNLIAWATSLGLIILTVMLVLFSIFPSLSQH